jgi:hypothetical protein
VLVPNSMMLRTNTHLSTMIRRLSTAATTKSATSCWYTFKSEGGGKFLPTQCSINLRLVEKVELYNTKIQFNLTSASFWEPNPVTTITYATKEEAGAAHAEILKKLEEMR